MSIIEYRDSLQIRYHGGTEIILYCQRHSWRRNTLQHDEFRSL